MEIKNKEFEIYVNTLRQKALENLAVQTDPHKKEFDNIIAEIWFTKQEQKTLILEAVEESMEKAIFPCPWMRR